MKTLANAIIHIGMINVVGALLFMAIIILSDAYGYPVMEKGRKPIGIFTGHLIIGLILAITGIVFSVHLEEKQKK